MGLFRKRSKSTDGRDAAPVAAGDPALPFLTGADADHVRALVREVFAEAGIEVTVHPDHVVDDTGTGFGLWNVAAKCHDHPAGRGAWRDVVREHVHSVLAMMDEPDPFEELTPGQAAASTYGRLYYEASIPNLDDYPHREFAPGIVEMLALDLPDSVAVFNRDHVARLGGFEALAGHGRTNLRALPVERHERVDGPRGGRFDALMGDSMIRYAGDAFASTGQVSPHVYWWDGTGYQQLTAIGEDGEISVVVGPEFQEVLEAVAGR